MRQDIKNQSVFIYSEKYAVLFINSEKKIINSFYLLLDIVGCWFIDALYVDLQVSFYQDMEKQTRKILKISGIISGGLIIAAFIVIAIALNFVFTSEKLTPVVLKTANQNLNAKLDIKDVELTFFSTFPRLGLKLKDGTLVSKVIRDTMWQRTDTLLSFKKAVLVIDVM